MKTDASKFSFRAVEAFVASVEEGSITAAAKRLGNSISAVSLQLSNLETSLGAKLLVRSSQRFGLTPAGEVFHPRALRILDEVTAATAAVSTTGTTAKILVRIATIEDFDLLVLPAWFAAVKERFPGIRFQVRSGPSHENHAALAGRTVDMIVAVDTIDPAEWIEHHTILRDPYILVGSADAHSKMSVDSLLKLPFVRYSRELLMGRQIEAHLRRNNIAPVREHEFSSNQAIFSMVEALGGWTITTVSAFASHALTQKSKTNGPTLFASPLPLPAFSRTISLYARKDALGELPDRFAEALRNGLEEQFIKPLETAHPFTIDECGFQVLDV